MKRTGKFFFSAGVEVDYDQIWIGYTNNYFKKLEIIIYFFSYMFRPSADISNWKQIIFLILCFNSRVYKSFTNYKTMFRSQPDFAGTKWCKFKSVSYLCGYLFGWVKFINKSMYNIFELNCIFLILLIYF